MISSNIIRFIFLLILQRIKLQNVHNLWLITFWVAIPANVKKMILRKTRLTKKIFGKSLFGYKDKIITKKTITTTTTASTENYLSTESESCAFEPDPAPDKHSVLRPYNWKECKCLDIFAAYSGIVKLPIYIIKNFNHFIFRWNFTDYSY